MTLLTDIMERGRHNKHAVSRVDSSGQYRFESYTYGISRYFRVCVALKAVYRNVSRAGDVYTGSVDEVPMPKRYLSEQRCIDALVKQAKEQGIA